MSQPEVVEGRDEDGGELVAESRAAHSTVAPVDSVIPTGTGGGDGPRGGEGTGPGTGRGEGAEGRSQVVRGSLLFTVAVGIGAVGGLAYLSLAARINADDRSIVGTAGFLFQALLLVNYVASMGVPIAVARFAPANDKSVNTLFNWALISTATSSLAGTIGFFVVARTVFDEQTAALFERGAPAGLLIFFTLLVGQSFATLVEIRLVTMRLWGWVLTRVILVVTLRLALFAIPALATSPVGLFVIMTGTPALSGFAGALALHFVHPRRDRGVLFPLPRETRLVVRFAIVNWVAMLATQAPQFISPLIVGKFVDKVEYGAFFVAWTIVTVVFLIPHTVGQTVVSEGSRVHIDVDRQVRLGLAVAGGIMIAMAAGAFVLGGYAVRLLFGDGYQLATEILPRMVAAGVPWAVTAILLARARVYQQQVVTVLITGGFAVSTLVPVSLLASANGVPGAATAWLVGNVVAAVLALVTTVLGRSSHRSTTSELA